MDMNVQHMNVILLNEETLVFKLHADINTYYGLIYIATDRNMSFTLQLGHHCNFF